MKLTITRTQETAECTFGVLNIDDHYFCVTLELPWLHNQHNISCIPVGAYKGRRHSSPKFGEVWEICGVPGRGEILIHVGNLPADTHGCVLVGSVRGIVNGQKGIVNSKDTLKRLMELTRHETEIDIEVKNNEQVS